MPTFDFQDGQGPVPAHQHSNGGGWVADTAAVAPTVWVSPYATVCHYAVCRNDARIEGRARVFGGAVVMDQARVSDNAIVKGRACVGDMAQVCDNAIVADDSAVLGTSVIAQFVNLTGKCVISGNTILSGRFTVNNTKIHDGESDKKIDEPNKPVLTLEVVQYELPRDLVPDLYEKVLNQGERQIRRTLNAWPFGKILTHKYICGTPSVIEWRWEDDPSI